MDSPPASFVIRPNFEFSIQPQTNTENTDFLVEYLTFVRVRPCPSVVIFKFGIAETRAVIPNSTTDQHGKHGLFGRIPDFCPCPSVVIFEFGIAAPESTPLVVLRAL
jgi:hypothetical protein